MTRCIRIESDMKSVKQSVMKTIEKCKSRVTVEMLISAGWHKVQTKYGWNLWAHGGKKKSYTFADAAKIYKEDLSSRDSVTND